VEQTLCNVEFREENDRVSSKMENQGFTVKTLYNVLQTRQSVQNFKQLWSLKLPAKIKTFCGE
jgi:hypothetical protein